MNHVEECPMRVLEDDREFDFCICERLLKAGARGYKSGYDDAREVFEVPTGVWDEESYNSGYWEGYEQGYDSALSNHVCDTLAPESGFDWPPNFNQHGTGENP